MPTWLPGQDRGCGGVFWGRLRGRGSIDGDAGLAAAGVAGRAEAAEQDVAEGEQQRHAQNYRDDADAVVVPVVNPLIAHIAVTEWIEGHGRSPSTFPLAVTSRQAVGSTEQRAGLTNSARRRCFEGC